MSDLPRPVYSLAVATVSSLNGQAYGHSLGSQLDTYHYIVSQVASSDSFGAWTLLMTGCLIADSVLCSSNYLLTTGSEAIAVQRT